MPQTPASTPTPHAPSTQGEWKARPVLAWLIRAALIVVPLLVSWVTVRMAMRFVTRPDGVVPTIGWFAGAVVLSSIVFQIVRRSIGHFSSLGILFSLSLTFPDAAPSRMRAFLGSRAEREPDRLAALVDSEFDAAMKTKRLTALLTKVSRREARSGRHGDRVRGYAELIARELGLAEAEIERLRWATLLHDVGLLDVPQRLLDTRGDLTAEDRELVEQHPVHAVGHLAPFTDWLGPWAGAATDHHERWDGSGYPAGTAGEEISLAGRIVAVADAYDAMTALRSYRKPISPSAARRELVDNAGTQFDPTVVRAFLEVGIDNDRAGVGALGALLEAPGQLLTAASGAGAGVSSAGLVVASAVVVATTAAAIPAISAEVDQPAVQVERIVEPPEETTTTTAPPSTTRRPTTTRRSTTSTSTTTTEPATTTVIPTTTTVVAPTTTSPPAVTTSPPTTTTTPPPIPTTTTTVPSYPTPPPTTTSTTLPTYPSV